MHPLPLLPARTPRERIDALLRSLEVLAPYEPAAILVLHRPGRPRADGGRRGCARSPARPRGSASGSQSSRSSCEGIESWSTLNTLGDAAGFVDEVGSDALGIQFDVWHLWNTPDLLDEIRATPT